MEILLFFWILLFDKFKFSAYAHFFYNMEVSMKSFRIAMASSFFALFCMSNTSFASEQSRALKQFQKQQNKILFSKGKDKDHRKKRGRLGPQGYPGSTGGPGTPGTPGTPGAAGLTSFISSVVNVDSSNGNGQTVAPQAPIIFNTDITTGFNITNNMAGTFTVTNAGVYEIIYGAYPDVSALSVVSQLVELALNITNGVTTNITANSAQTTQSAHDGTVPNPPPTAPSPVMGSNHGWLPASYIVSLNAGATIQVINNAPVGGSNLIFDTSGSNSDTHAFITIKQLM
jgi:hypothetical protein